MKEEVKDIIVFVLIIVVFVLTIDSRNGKDMIDVIVENIECKNTIEIKK